MYNGANGATFETHVYNPAGTEVGLYGPEGWFNKHGCKGAPDGIPADVVNRLNGIRIDQLRRMGLWPPKGKCPNRGKTPGRLGGGSVLPVIALIPQLLEFFDAYNRAQDADIDVWEQMLRDMGVYETPNYDDPRLQA
jgi:hypothetical protein